MIQRSLEDDKRFGRQNHLKAKKNELKEKEG